MTSSTSLLSPCLFRLQEGPVAILSPSLLDTSTSPAVSDRLLSVMWMKSVLIPLWGELTPEVQLLASLSGRSAIPALGRHLLKTVPGTFRGHHFPWQVCLLAGPTSRFARAERHLGSISLHILRGEVRRKHLTEHALSGRGLCPGKETAGM